MFCMEDRKVMIFMDKSKNFIKKTDRLQEMGTLAENIMSHLLKALPGDQTEFNKISQDFIKFGTKSKIELKVVVYGLFQVNPEETAAQNIKKELVENALFTNALWKEHLPLFCKDTSHIGFRSEVSPLETVQKYMTDEYISGQNNCHDIYEYVSNDQFFKKDGSSDKQTVLIIGDGKDLGLDFLSGKTQNDNAQVAYYVVGVATDKNKNWASDPIYPAESSDDIYGTFYEVAYDSLLSATKTWNEIIQMFCRRYTYANNFDVLADDVLIRKNETHLEEEVSSTCFKSSDEYIHIERQDLEPMVASIHKQYGQSKCYYKCNTYPNQVSPLDNWRQFIGTAECTVDAFILIAGIDLTQKCDFKASFLVPYWNLDSNEMSTWPGKNSKMNENFPNYEKFSTDQELKKWSWFFPDETNPANPISVDPDISFHQRVEGVQVSLVRLDVER